VNLSSIDFTMLMRPDDLLSAGVASMGVFVYLILFAVIFAETGLVVAPLLPGDSLLFMAGAFAGAGKLQFWPLLALLLLAAVLGDAVNYWIGRSLGRGILERSDGRFIKREHVEQTEVFFRKHGGKTVVLARFVPIVRTFAPFVAGMCDMPLLRFWAFNITGAVAWVVLFTGAGYLFGNLPWVEENLTFGILVVVALSVIPFVFEAWRRRRASRASVAAAAAEALVEPEPASSEGPA
jgi:membrane-associated protein